MGEPERAKHQRAVCFNAWFDGEQVTRIEIWVFRQTIVCLRRHRIDPIGNSYVHENEKSPVKRPGLQTWELEAIMSRRHFIAAGLLVTMMAVLFSAPPNFLAGTPRRPMTGAQGDALVRREVPANASVSQVNTWLNAKQIEHGGYEPHHANGAGGTILAVVRDTGHPGLFITADTQLIFTFGKHRRLISHSVYTLLTSP